jgi:Mn2+/Fe2+ NRAMP family transporter
LLPLTMAVMELAARVGLVTDRGLAATVRERFAKPIVAST